jgi:hypothetical protein
MIAPSLGGTGINVQGAGIKNAGDVDATTITAKTFNAGSCLLFRFVTLQITFACQFCRAVV